MLITKEVEVQLRKNKKHYESFGYDTNVEIGELILIKTEHLTKGSHTKVVVGCDFCGKESTKDYKEYLHEIKDVNLNACSNKECSNQKIKAVCLKKYGVENTFQAGFVKDKIKVTLTEKYGVEHPMFIKETKDKIKDTCVERYGVSSYTKTIEYQEKTKKTNLDKYGATHDSKTKEGQLKRKLTRISRGNQIPDKKLSEFFLYRKRIDNFTDNIRDIFIEKWDGIDFYDGEYIKDNFNLDSGNKLYPTIDHKVSVYYGFTNGLKIEDIANLDNLCFTKRGLNAKKGNKNHDVFIEELKKADN